ncbi:MAG: hypothetical protein J3Q66DRAFT_421579 [Benniella sp.]|nr:MAG: hypothetical protein J3Q66DRAFT_421579 [Benniella sp.]
MTARTTLFFILALALAITGPMATAAPPPELPVLKSDRQPLGLFVHHLHILQHHHVRYDFTSSFHLFSTEPGQWTDYKEFIQKTYLKHCNYTDGAMFYSLFVSHLRNIASDDREDSARRSAARSLLGAAKVDDFEKVFTELQTAEDFLELCKNRSISPPQRQPALKRPGSTQPSLALSGILNATMSGPHLYIDPQTLERVKDHCKKQDFSEPKRLPFLKETLEPLRETFSLGGVSSLRKHADRAKSGEDNTDIQSVALDLISYFFRFRSQFQLKEPQGCYESDSVSTWSHILRIASQYKLDFDTKTRPLELTGDLSQFKEAATAKYVPLSDSADVPASVLVEQVPYMDESMIWFFLASSP